MTLFMDLTEKQIVIIETIQKFKKEHGRPPYKKELAELLPWKPSIHALAFSVRYLIQRDCLQKVSAKGYKIDRIKGQEKQCQLIDVTPYGEHCYNNVDFRYEKPVKEKELSKFVFTEEEDDALVIIDNT